MPPPTNQTLSLAMYHGANRTTSARYPRQRPRLDDFPRRDGLGPGVTIGQSPLELPLLGLGERRPFNLPSGTLPDGLRKRHAVLRTEAIDPQFLQAWRHGVHPID